MAYSKTIVCLAKSIKHGGYCIAGKELVDNRFAGWIRPVSDREDEEIRSAECRCDDGTELRLLDVVTIPLLEARPSAYQIENHLIDANQRWRRHRSIQSTRTTSHHSSTTSTVHCGLMAREAPMDSTIEFQRTLRLDSAILLCSSSQLSLKFALRSKVQNLGTREEKPAQRSNLMASSIS